MFTEEIRDGIVIITLDHGKTNSVTTETMKGIHGIIRKVNEDDALKGIVLTGQGKFFSSGFHLPTFINFADHAAAVDFFEFEEGFLLDLFTCSKPVVCAMNGHSAAMGLIMGMAADYRIVSDHPKVKIGMSEIKLGLPLTIAQTEVMRYGFDTDKTFESIMYFGRMYSPEQALELGLVDAVAPADELVERAMKVVSKWIDNPNRAFIRMKELLRYDTAERIRTKLAAFDWKPGLACFFDPQVKGTLEFVEAAMNG